MVCGVWPLLLIFMFLFFLLFLKVSRRLTIYIRLTPLLIFQPGSFILVKFFKVFVRDCLSSLPPRRETKKTNHPFVMGLKLLNSWIKSDSKLKLFKWNTLSTTSLKTASFSNLRPLVHNRPKEVNYKIFCVLIEKAWLFDWNLVTELQFPVVMVFKHISKHDKRNLKNLSNHSI